MVNLPDFAALITAAGLSSQMESLKPLLPYREGTMLSECVAMMRGSGAGRVYVTVGRDGPLVAEEARRCGAIPVELPNYQEKQMLDSICCGLEAMRRDGVAGQVALHACDIPGVRAETVYQLRMLQACVAGSAVRPSFEGKGGHPLVMAGALVPDILAYRGGQGLRGFLSTLDDLFITMPCDDPMVCRDADTPQEYAELLRQEGSSVDEGRMLSKPLADAIMAAMPPPLTAHCRAVADYADALARRLFAMGTVVDRPLLYQAGLLHDMCRGEADHAGVAAAHLRRMGCPWLAEIIGMHHGQVDTSHISEALLLIYADRRVRGAEIVTLKERFDASRVKCKTPEALAAHQTRYQSALAAEAAIRMALNDERI